ncbi:hypothetical protein [Nostoc sp.]
MHSSLTYHGWILLVSAFFCDFFADSQSIVAIAWTCPVEQIHI